MRILHISDTHVLGDYSVNHPNSVLNRVTPPAENLARLLVQAAGWPVDAVLHTGDITHEGDGLECRSVRDLFAAHLPGVPVLYAKGNHDAPQPYWEVLAEEAGPCYQRCFGGYRFLVLDTASLHNPNGSVSPAQEDWLADKLKMPFGNGTLLLGHHPLACRQRWFTTSVSPRLWDILQHSDVLAYLCGHIHYAETEVLPGGIPQYTAASLAFGLDSTETDMVFTGEMGYNLCHLQGPRLTVAARPFGVVQQVLAVNHFAGSEE